MNKVKKILITILIDIVALAVIVVCVYGLLFKNPDTLNENILTGIIVILIPVVFYSIYIAVAWDKYDEGGKLKNFQKEDEEDSNSSS